jgi:YD repeat-containing protein
MIMFQLCCCLIIVHDKNTLLIGTWKTTHENNATTRVEWDTLGQVIRKVRERLPYPEGASGEASLLEYREVLGSNCL